MWDFYAHYPSSFSGVVGRKQHLALDLAVRGTPDGGIGWPLLACESGLIRRMPSALGGPHQLAIETPTNVFLYAHMSSSAPVQWPDTIAEGDLIGSLGREGFSFVEPGHLHFMQWDKAARRFVDPSAYLARACRGPQPLLSRFPALDEAVDYVKENPALALGAIGVAAALLASRKERY